MNILEKYLFRLSGVHASLDMGTEDGTPSFALHDIDLELREGEWLTVIGRNGSGKSTLSKLIAGVRFAALEGHVSRHAGLRQQGRPIPVVMQQPEASMIGSTPWEDVVLMLEQNGMAGERIAAAADEALQRAGLYGRRHQSVGTLSGGQKQLTAIAGCLATQAKLLILDEATAMLDPEASRKVLELVRALHASGASVLWITQRLDELRPGDRVLAMADGRIAFDGSAENFYKRGASELPNAGHERVRYAASPCELLGFDAPYVVRTVWELEERGIRLSPLPMTPESLREAVLRHA